MFNPISPYLLFDDNGDGGVFFMLEWGDGGRWESVELFKVVYWIYYIIYL